MGPIIGRRVGATVVGAAALLAVSLVCGCGSSPTEAPVAGKAPSLINALNVGAYEPTDGQYYRYRDVIDHQYASRPMDPYGPGDYNGCYDPADLVTYALSDGSTLMGTMTATGLKPHFAYQVKLEGQPTALYGECVDAPPEDVANWSNIRIGSVGRWWCVDPSYNPTSPPPGSHAPWNVTDAELASGAHDNHLVKGYLLFDFFVTDINGDATQALFLDSSFHVLWRTDQRRPNRRLDGKPRTHTVTWSETVYGGTSFSSKAVQIYAEGESGRPRPGQVTLPAGEYACRLLLTEESFHNAPPGVWQWAVTEYPDGGFWAHALSDEDFGFTIVGDQPPTPGAMHIATIGMQASTKGPFTTVTATVAVVDAGGIAVPDATVSGEWTGVTGATNAVTDSAGRATLKSSRVSGSGTATFAVTNLDKTGWTYDESANVETQASVDFG